MLNTLRLQDAKKPSRFQRLVTKLIWKVIVSDPRNICYTINAGDASVIACVHVFKLNDSLSLIFVHLKEPFRKTTLNDHLHLNAQPSRAHYASSTT